MLLMTFQPVKRVVRHDCSLEYALSSYVKLCMHKSTAAVIEIAIGLTLGYFDRVNIRGIPLYIMASIHVLFPTHRHSHTLDLVITSANSTLSPIVISLPISPTDHFPIICSLKITNSPTAPKTKLLTRAIRVINITELCHDILLV